MRCMTVALCCLPAVSIAASDDPKELERQLAQVRSEPMVFIVATGEPNACGRGCSEWIAGEGRFDEGATQRFREFLAVSAKRDLPIFFNSDGGLLREAVQIGSILRENRMTVGVARTVAEGCHRGSPLDDACRRLMQSKREHKARLYFGGARCASACVYAMVGASTRHVDPGAKLPINSNTGREIEKANNSLRRYVVAMGVDPGLVDAAAKIPSRSSRELSRGEMERFGIETRGLYETPWFAYHGPAGEFLLLKSVTYPTGDTADEYRTRTVGLACSRSSTNIRFMYHQELTAKESRTPPMIRAKIGDSLIDLTTLNPQKDLVERSFDLEPRQLQSAIETGSFEIAEMFDQSMIKTPSRVVRFSTLGLSANIVALESKCASKRGSPSLSSSASAPDKSPEQRREEGNRILTTEGLRKEQATRVVASSKNQRIGFFTYLTPDCDSGGEVEVRITKKPEHGTAETTTATNFPNYPKENIRARCNEHKVRGVQINYESAEKYVGSDELELLVLFPGGFAWEVHYDISVR